MKPTDIVINLEKESKGVRLEKLVEEARLIFSGVTHVIKNINLKGGEIEAKREFYTPEGNMGVNIVRIKAVGGKIYFDSEIEIIDGYTYQF